MIPTLPSVNQNSRLRSLSRVSLICLMAAITGLAGCQSSGPKSRAPAPAAPAEPLAPHQLSAESPNFLRLSKSPTDRPPVRIGLLLPFSNGSAATRNLANSMLNSAQMAISDTENPDLLLIPADEGTNPADAAKAARKLLASGAEIIVGPLFAGSVKSVAPLARDSGVPVLALSTDRAVAGHGVYLLSFQPENEIHSIVAYAASKGRRNFAALIPQNDYGDRVAAAFAEAVAARKGRVTEIQRFNPAQPQIDLQAAAIARSNPDSLLIAQGGSALRSIAPMLRAHGVDMEKVKLLGTGLWYDPANAREPALAGAWIAAPAPHAQDGFGQKYRSIFDSSSPQLATLTYDAISLVGLMAPGEPYRRFNRYALTDPNGFAGVDGIFRFKPDGTAERGLAILTVTPEGFKVIASPPATFQQAGF